MAYCREEQTQNEAAVTKKKIILYKYSFFHTDDIAILKTSVEKDAFMQLIRHFFCKDKDKAYKVFAYTYVLEHHISITFIFEHFVCMFIFFSSFISVFDS